MTPATLAILFFAAAVVLLVAEVFLPAHGLLGVLGAVGLVCGVGACFFINQYLGLAAAVGVVFLTPFAAALWVKVWPHTPAGKRLILGPPDAAAVAGLATPRVHVGQVGLVVSELRPGGVCEFLGAARVGERVEARAEHGGVIPAGRRVEVVAVADGRPVVRPVVGEEAAMTRV